MSPEKPSIGARVTATSVPSGETAGSHSSWPASAATRRSQGKSVLVTSTQICCWNGAASAASSRSRRPPSQFVVTVARDATSRPLPSARATNR